MDLYSFYPVLFFFFFLFLFIWIIYILKVYKWSFCDNSTDSEKVHLTRTN